MLSDFRLSPKLLKKLKNLHFVIPIKECQIFAGCALPPLLSVVGKFTDARAIPLIGGGAP